MLFEWTTYLFLFSVSIPNSIASIIPAHIKANDLKRLWSQFTPKYLQIPQVNSRGLLLPGNCPLIARGARGIYLMESIARGVMFGNACVICWGLLIASEIYHTHLMMVFTHMATWMNSWKPEKKPRLTPLALRRRQEGKKL